MAHLLDRLKTSVYDMAKEVQKPYEEVASEKGGQARASPMHTEGEGRDHGGDFQGPSGLQHGLCPSETELGGISERLQMMSTSHRSPQSTLTPACCFPQGSATPTSTWGGTATTHWVHSMVCFCREGIKDKHKKSTQDLSCTDFMAQPHAPPGNAQHH